MIDIFRAIYLSFLKRNGRIIFNLNKLPSGAIYIDIYDSDNSIRHRYVLSFAGAWKIK